MIIHIVHAKENIYLIAEHYHVDVNDVISINQHITDFMHLQPGMKIKIPLIGEEIKEDLDESEPFIEDYYSVEAPKEETKEETKNTEIKFPYYYYKNRGIPFDK